MPPLRSSIRAAGQWLLAHDNLLFGIVITPIALRTWYHLHSRYEASVVYFANDIYLVPSLSLLTILLSAIYLTATCCIMLTAKPPLARYDTLLPNLLGVPAAFGVYAFSLISPSATRAVPVYAALLLLALGAGLVVATLYHLRQSFSVTPQARRFVCSGPYRAVRHPMYLGNLLTMTGLALLLNTPLAYVIAAVNGVLQVVRGRYEDRLLSATFPEYEGYMKQVGGFLPKFSVPKDAAIAASLVALVLPIAQASTPAEAMSFSIRRPASALIQLAGGGSAKCAAWYSKAMSGQWFTNDDGSAFYELDQSDPAVASDKTCRNFFDLQEKCQAVAADGADASHDFKRIIGLLESTPGCKSIIGAYMVCQNLEAAGEGGKKLSAKMQAILPDCADQSVLDNSATFLRLGE